MSITGGAVIVCEQCRHDDCATIRRNPTLLDAVRAGAR